MHHFLRAEHVPGSYQNQQLMSTQAIAYMALTTW